MSLVGRIRVIANKFTSVIGAFVLCRIQNWSFFLNSLPPFAKNHSAVFLITGITFRCSFNHVNHFDVEKHISIASTFDLLIRSLFNVSIDF